jgi:uncharacterized cupin superfamily protein
MSAHPKIVVLDRLQTGESANPSPANILAGIPRARVSNQYAEPTHQFFCGIWTSTAGKWRVRYTEHEFCVIIEGRVSRARNTSCAQAMPSSYPRASRVSGK